jgi:hypothetical protein
MKWKKWLRMMILLCEKCGKIGLNNHQVKIHLEELYQWRLMVGTLSTPKKGCGQ